MGELGKELVRNHFLITPHLRDYFTLMTVVRSPGGRVL
jgi:hypothetical protein